jgi:hypothetical protein
LYGGRVGWIRCISETFRAERLTAKPIGAGVKPWYYYFKEAPMELACADAGVMLPPGIPRMEFLSNRLNRNEG